MSLIRAALAAVLLCAAAPALAQGNANGSSDFRGFAGYLGTDPVAANLRYDLRLAADNSLIGAAGQVPASVSVDTVGKTISYQINNFTPTGAFFVQLYEAVNVLGPDGQANERRCDTPYVLNGVVVMSQGQSNMGNSDSSTGTATVSLQAEAWGTTPAVAANGPETMNNGPIIQSGNALAGTTGATQATYIVNAAITGPVTYIAAAVGGTTAAARGPGGSTGMYEAATDAIRKSGGRVSYIRWADGESDAGNIVGGTYKSDVYKIIDGFSSTVGTTLPVLMEAMGGYPTAGDVANENVRRLQMFTMPADRPGQIVPAAFSLDLQMANVKPYLHFTSDAYNERARRAGFALAKFRGQSTYDRLGPKLVSARRVDDTHIGVTFSLGAFTNMAMSAGGGSSPYTTGKTDVYGGGIRFGTQVGTPSGATSATITGGRLYANATPTVGTVANGAVEVVWAFGSTLPATIYVGGPYGCDPYNPDQVDAIQIDFANKASILQGTISGELSVGCQPYWNVSGNDYLTAS